MQQTISQKGNRPAIRAAGGFTLVELMVAVLIVGILAAIAVPSYSNYVRKGRRTDAKSALLDLASLEERYFSVNNSYSETTTQLGYAGGWPVTVGGGYYTIATPTVVAATTTAAATFSLTATVTTLGGQNQDTQCQTFTVTSAGVQSATPDPTNTCWK